MRRKLKRTVAWMILTVAALWVALVFLSCPVWRGYHIGSCTSWEGGTGRVWVGVPFCRTAAPQEP